MNRKKVILSILMMVFLIAVGFVLPHLFKEKREKSRLLLLQRRKKLRIRNNPQVRQHSPFWILVPCKTFSQKGR